MMQFPAKLRNHFSMQLNVAPAWRTQLCLSFAILFASPAMQSQTLTTIANFPATEYPASLVQGPDGNFYGTTYSGGTFTSASDIGPVKGAGTVFAVTAAGVLTVLHNFGGMSTDGVNPDGLIVGADGNFYGITALGGSVNDGTVFKTTPAGMETTLFTFDGVDGELPSALIQGKDGNFYGTTTNANESSAGGSVFQLTPSGKLTTLYNFQGLPFMDGANPTSLIQGSDGNFYGTTTYGGMVANLASPCNFAETEGCGTVFEVSPTGTETVLYRFGASATDGSGPGGLLQAADGNLYGFTTATIFKITTAGAFTTLYGFGSALNNGDGVEALIQGSDGNLYGVTGLGGGGTCQSGCGTIFKLTLSGTETTLYEFCTLSACTDGSNPTRLIQGEDGNLYGSTSVGPGNGGGTLFKFVLPPANAPQITATNGVLNGASFQPGISGGSWITISGTNLSSQTDTWNNSIVNGALPIMLDGVGVSVGGQPAYIEYVSATQINAVAPNVPAGSVPVTVTTANGTSQAVMAQLSAEQPAFFQWGKYAVATRQNFSLAVKNGTFPGTTTVPAAPGDVIILWGTGFGPTSPLAPAGVETPSTTTYNTATAVSVTVGNKPATVYGAALAPGYAGLFQVAIQIPTSLVNGDYPVIATINGVQSLSTTLITVEQ